MRGVIEIEMNVMVSVLGRDDESYPRVFDFINSVEKCFPTPISQKTDISAFTTKILDKAVVLQAVMNDEIVGLSSFYANDIENRKAYWTFLAVTPSCMNMGIGSRLLTKMLSILRNMKMVSVELTTESNNVAARSLYEKFGFRLAEEKDEKVKYVYYLQQE